MAQSAVSYAEFCLTCNARTQFNAVYTGRTLREDHNYRAILWMCTVECSMCRLLMVGAGDADGKFQSFGGMELGRREYPDVPEVISSAASESYTCFRAGASRGAIMLARAVIEATAKDLGIVSGNLFGKIDEMFAERHIREYVRDGAHELRHFGNDMAHGDFGDDIEREDVELALELMDKVLDEVYQSPAQVERARAKRAARSTS